MPVIPESRFGRRLALLDSGELAAFVGDLWEARGWETRLNDRTVVATGGPADRTVRFHCVAPGRLGRPALPEGAADVVVSTRDRRAVRAAATDRGLAFVGPSELREVARYAVDRGTADRIVAEHLGRPLRTDEPDGRRSSNPLGRTHWRALGTGLLVVLLAGVVIAGAGGVGVPFGDAENRTAPSGADTPTETIEPPTTAAPTPESDRFSVAEDYPPGVGPEGVTDAGRLAAAHAEALARTTHRLVVVHRGSADVLFDDREWVYSRQTVDQAGPTHYRYHFSGVAVARNGTTREVAFQDFADGTYDYRRIPGPDGPTYRRGLIPTGGGDGLFTAVAEAYIRRFLATDDGYVAVERRDAQTMYRVVATGVPDRVVRPAWQYRAVAIVDAVGRVHRLTVTYVRPGSGIESYPTAGESIDTGAPNDIVRFELVYEDIGGTTVGEPSWYPAARNGTDETEVNLWPGDPRWWSPPIGIDYREDT